MRADRTNSRKDIPVVIEKRRLVRVIKVNWGAFIALKSGASRERNIAKGAYV